MSTAAVASQPSIRHLTAPLFTPSALPHPPPASQNSAGQACTTEGDTMGLAFPRDSTELPSDATVQKALKQDGMCGANSMQLSLNPPRNPPPSVCSLLLNPSSLYLQFSQDCWGGLLCVLLWAATLCREALPLPAVSCA